jgi:hypothetical protein
MYVGRGETETQRRSIEAFLSAVETLSKLNKDPGFYKLAVNAVRSSYGRSAPVSRAHYQI